jgi:hypothetical protein
MADTLPMIAYSELSRKHAALLAAVASMDLGDAASSYVSDASLAVENEMLKQQLATARAQISELTDDLELLRRIAAAERSENDAIKRALRTLRCPFATVPRRCAVPHAVMTCADMRSTRRRKSYATAQWTRATQRQVDSDSRRRCVNFALLSNEVSVAWTGLAARSACPLRCTLWTSHPIQICGRRDRNYLWTSQPTGFIALRLFSRALALQMVPANRSRVRGLLRKPHLRRSNDRQIIIIGAPEHSRVRITPPPMFCAA